MEKIAALDTKKIQWTFCLDDPNAAAFIVMVDGTDFQIWEPKHPTLPVNKQYCLHKFKHGTLYYGIALSLSVHTGKCVLISNPYPGGVHNMTIFREGLKQKIAPGKLVIVNQGYKSQKSDKQMMSMPNSLDSKAVAKFKSRARCRQESYNGRLKNFAILSKTYRHSLEKHKYVLQAIAVMLQVQMDNGACLFEA